jgi:hypothetical protein
MALKHWRDARSLVSTFRHLDRETCLQPCTSTVVYWCKDSALIRTGTWVDAAVCSCLRDGRGDTVLWTVSGVGLSAEWRVPPLTEPFSPRKMSRAGAQTRQDPPVGGWPSATQDPAHRRLLFLCGFSCCFTTSSLTSFLQSCPSMGTLDFDAPQRLGRFAAAITTTLLCSIRLPRPA